MKKKNLHPTLTNQKLEDQEEDVKIVYIIILLILSGVILYSDKILNYFNIGSNIDFKYYSDLESFIWHLSQTISPILILCALALYVKNKFIKFALLTPLSIYSIQVMYILADESYIENEYFIYYTIAFIATEILSFYLLNSFVKSHTLRISKLKSSIRDLVHLVFGFKNKSFDINNPDTVDKKVYSTLEKVASDE
jgi:hypothetical protein